MTARTFISSALGPRKEPGREGAAGGRGRGLPSPLPLAAFGRGREAAADGGPRCGKRARVARWGEREGPEPPPRRSRFAEKEPAGPLSPSPPSRGLPKGPPAPNLRLPPSRGLAGTGTSVEGPSRGLGARRPPAVCWGLPAAGGSGRAVPRVRLGGSEPPSLRAGLTSFNSP